MHSQAVPACPRRQGPCVPGISCLGSILIKRPLSFQGIVKSWYSHCQQQSPKAKPTDQTDICTEDRQAKNGLLRHNQKSFFCRRANHQQRAPRKKHPADACDRPTRSSRSLPRQHHSGQAFTLPLLTFPALGETSWTFLAIGFLLSEGDKS